MSDGSAPNACTAFSVPSAEGEGNDSFLQAHTTHNTQKQQRQRKVCMSAQAKQQTKQIVGCCALSCVRYVASRLTTCSLPRPKEGPQPSQ